MRCASNRAKADELSRENANDTNQVVIVDLSDANNVIRRPSEYQLHGTSEKSKMSLADKDSHCRLGNHAPQREDHSFEVYVQLLIVCHLSQEANRYSWSTTTVVQPRYQAEGRGALDER